jgi:hypothetical protein
MGRHLPRYIPVRRVGYLGSVVDVWTHAHIVQLDVSGMSFMQHLPRPNLFMIINDSWVFKGHGLVL